MSTRAVYSFQDRFHIYHVYKHYDGYPTGAAKWLTRAKLLAWPLPRYEADDFAAAFVAANKLPNWCDEAILTGIEKSKNRKTTAVSIKNPYPKGLSVGGDIRLLHSGGKQSVYDIAPADIEYRYVVYQGNDNHTLWVNAFSTNFWDNKRDEELLFTCKLDDMEAKAKDYDEQVNA